MKTLKVLFLMAVAGMTSSLTSHAQSYDDDIYYTEPSKKEASKASKPKTPAVNSNGYGVTTVYDYPAADTYSVLPSQGGAIMDVDAYNRRGFFATDTVSVNDLPQYERIASQYYYPDAATVNIDGSGSTIYTSGDVNVVNATPSVSYVYGNPYYNTWYGYNYYSPWYTPGWYDPWYRPGWSISWGWNNYWGPSWSWGWNYPWGGPSWYPGWRPTPPPSHRPGWRPGRPSPGRNDLRPGRLPNPGTSPGRRPAYGTSSPGRGTYTPSNGTSSPGRGSYTPSNGTSSPGRGSYTPSNGSSSPGRGSYTLLSWTRWQLHRARLVRWRTQLGRLLRRSQRTPLIHSGICKTN